MAAVISVGSRIGQFPAPVIWAVVGLCLATLRMAVRGGAVPRVFIAVSMCPLGLLTLTFVNYLLGKETFGSFAQAAASYLIAALSLIAAGYTWTARTQQKNATAGHVAWRMASLFVLVAATLGQVVPGLVERLDLGVNRYVGSTRVIQASGFFDEPAAAGVVLALALAAMTADRRSRADRWLATGAVLATGSVLGIAALIVLSVAGRLRTAAELLSLRRMLQVGRVVVVLLAISLFTPIWGRVERFVAGGDRSASLRVNASAAVAKAGFQQDPLLGLGLEGVREGITSGSIALGALPPAVTADNFSWNGFLYAVAVYGAAGVIVLGSFLAIATSRSGVLVGLSLLIWMLAFSQIASPAFWLILPVLFPSRHGSQQERYASLSTSPDDERSAETLRVSMATLSH